MPLTIDLTGRTAWVTGGASGIGAAIVRMLAGAGARVVAIDRQPVQERMPCDGSVVGERVDLRDTASVNAAAARLVASGLEPDVLVNNAGICRDGVAWKLSDEAWLDVIDVNLSGAFRITRACCPAMRRRGGGAIVNIASINGLRGKFGQANYAASKGGLIAFTKSLARELARDGIRVNAVAPGFVETRMTKQLPLEARARARAETLLGRPGVPDDVAAAVLFLASPLAAHITGQVLVVDGGQLL